MKTISLVEFQSLVELGYESHKLEFKSPFKWDDNEKIWLREKTIQTILGMSNNRDGGKIIIGIEEKEDKPTFKGLTKDELDSFNSYDDIKGKVDGFASPFANFEIAKANYDNRNYVLIIVNAFNEIPIICKKNGNFKDDKGNYLLREGDIYVRSQSGTAGTRRVTEPEMRELIKMSVAKEYQNLKSRGLSYFGEHDEELFLKQQQDFDESVLNG